MAEVGGARGLGSERRLRMDGEYDYRRGSVFREIDKVRQLGYALDNEENEVGVRCIAAAIPDYRGRAFYAISLSAPTARMADERIVQLRGPLLRASRDIAQALGGSTGR